MKRCLITGGNGFLGSHILPLLGKYDVIAPRSAMFDLTEQMSVRAMITKFRPNIIINLAAAVGGIGFNRDNPARLFYENALIGILTMHEAYIHGVEKFVQVGTICAYPKITPVPFKEEDLWNGYPEDTNAPYGLAKKMLLVQAQAYRKQYGFNAIYLLPVNLYGPSDNFKDESSHVIPALIKRFIEAKEKNLPEVVIWGTGTPTREFLYVKDAARGIVAAMEKYDGEEPVNLGAGNEISIADLVNVIKEEIGYKGEVVYDSSKPDGQPRRLLDVTRAKKYFGFTAETSFRDGLRKTIDWYLSYRKSHPESL